MVTRDHPDHTLGIKELDGRPVGRAPGSGWIADENWSSPGAELLRRLTGTAVTPDAVFIPTTSCEDTAEGAPRVEWAGGACAGDTARSFSGPGLASRHRGPQGPFARAR
jgi:hypothetical protein